MKGSNDIMRPQFHEVRTVVAESTNSDNFDLDTS